MDLVDLPFMCHPFPSAITFAFQSIEMTLLLLDLDSYGGTNPLGRFPYILKRTIDVLASCLGVVFLLFLHLGSNHACLRLANVIF